MALKNLVIHIYGNKNYYGIPACPICEGLGTYTYPFSNDLNKEDCPMCFNTGYYPPVPPFIFCQPITFQILKSLIMNKGSKLASKVSRNKTARYLRNLNGVI